MDSKHMTLDLLKAYCSQIERALQAGNATEHTHRPALKTLLEGLAGSRATVTNEPRRIACGVPDYVITRPGGYGMLTLGYIEAKDVGKSLDEVERSGQMKRYLPALPNLILTDYLEFRWYVNGQRRGDAVRLARPARNGKLTIEPDSADALISLLQGFLAHEPEPISSSEELARRMARLTHLIRDVIVQAFEQDHASNLLRGWREAFAGVLLAGLDQPQKTAEFADMFAQTLAYGLFSARVMDTTPGFTRTEAQQLIPKTNPFLRKFFNAISGVDLIDEPYVGFVDDLVALLALADMNAVLENFGKRTRQQDPVVHFYETFLAAYDPQLREARGVYYTPEPVVSYIVRSVDWVLKSHFDCVEGLAQRLPSVPHPQPLPARGEGSKGAYSLPPQVETGHAAPFLPPSTGEGPGMGVNKTVLILDPACGTGTFLYSVIDLIRQKFIGRGNAGLWARYVREHLLPRLFGFELLMAPYAVAHFKLGLQLAGRDLPPDQRDDWAYDTQDNPDRLGVYLTNTLETAQAPGGQTPLLMRWLAEEANAADKVKRALPIMVVMGNPPYSGHSANKGAWIDGLLKGTLPGGQKVAGYYEVDGKPLGERNPKWLQDDYVKFIRFGQWRIEQTGAGVLAFITNHGYLDNPTFRGMRQQLLNAFTDIYILNLHGSSKKKETAPDGSADQNVFDIQQGVAIGVFVKEPGKQGPARVHHADLWGARKDKYTWLVEHDLETIEWAELQPQTPFYLFVPQDVDLRAEYEQGWRVTDVMPVNVLGFQTHRDSFAVDLDGKALYQRIRDMRDTTISDEAFRQRYDVTESAGWQLTHARESLRKRDDWENDFINCLYRPFDWRPCYFSDLVMDRPRRELVDHVAGKANLCLGLGRQGIAVNAPEWALVSVSQEPIDANIFRRGGITVFPLYLYSEVGRNRLIDAPPYPPDSDGRIPNLNPAFVAALELAVGLRFQPHAALQDEEPHPNPSPLCGEGLHAPTIPPLHSIERGPGGEVESQRFQPRPHLWEKLKPLARQMRHEPTTAEDQLWQALRNRQVSGFKFRRQFAIDRFIVDFYCAEAQLIIEVDGPIHEYTPDEDAVRQEFLESLGFRVIRFTNAQVIQSTSEIVNHIAAILKDEPHPSPLCGEGLHAPTIPPLHFMERGPGGEVAFFTPQDIFHYIYAIFHSPTYRARYAEFLKIDFPRVPLIEDVALFCVLCDKGRELVGLHLLEQFREEPSVTYPVKGSDVVDKGYPKYSEADQRVYINNRQYFDQVSKAVWEFQVGGYPVMEKWLKDRRGRKLSYDDLERYPRVALALSETIRLMDEIDAAMQPYYDTLT